MDTPNIRRKAALHSIITGGRRMFHRPGAVASLLAAAWLLGFPAVSQALNIVMVFDSAASQNPSYDPTGSRLQNIMDQVALAWEDIITDSGTVTIDYRWSENVNGLANATSTKSSTTGKPIGGDIDIDVFTGDNDDPTEVLVDWFIDDTPNTDEHWDLSQILYRGLSAAEQAVRFNPNDTPPDLLEVSYRGLTNAGAPADAAGYDLYTSMLHETGHVLGLASKYSDAADVDVETDPVWTGGNDFRATFDTNSDGDVTRGHLASTTSNKQLMCGSCAEKGARRFPTAMDILVIAELGGWNSIDLPRKDFITNGSGADFNTAANWIGNRVPDSDDAVFVRQGGVVELSGAAVADQLFLGYNSYLHTRGHDLAVSGTTTLQQDQEPVVTAIFKPLMSVETGSNMETRTLNIEEHTVLELEGGNIEVTGNLTNNGDIQGFGSLFVDDLLMNNGEIRASDDATLVLDTGSGGSTWNLDGDTATGETGELIATAGDIQILNGSMQEPFDGTITVGVGRFFQTDRSDSWTLGAGGALHLSGGPNPNEDDRARLKGGHVTIRGSVDIDEEAAIDAQSTFASAAEVTLNDGSDRVAVFGTIVSLLPETAATEATTGCTINAGATFTGNGILINGENNVMDLKDGANVGIKLSNGGQRLLIEGDDGTGSATVAELNLLEIGAINFDIDGPPDGSDFDHVTATAEVTVRGSLVVDFESNAPVVAGSRWRIIDGAVVDGVFTDVDIMGLPALWTADIEYFADGVDVVIRSRLVIGELLRDIPSVFTPGVMHSLSDGLDPTRNFRLYSSNPEIIGVRGGDLIPRVEGMATLRLDVLQEDGSILFDEFDVVVGPGDIINPNCPPYGLDAQLLDNLGSIDDHMGSSVDLSGNTAIGGAPGADTGGFSNSGKAAIWIKQAGAWVQQASLVIPAPAADDRAGFSVAIEGDVALVGAPGRGANTGEAHVFSRNAAGIWSPAGRLRPATGQAGQQFGFSVALSGSFAFVGAPGEATNGANAGTVTVFRRAAGSWTLVTEIRGADTVADDRFGSAIAFANSMLLCGAPGHAVETGAAYRFELTAGAGVNQTDKLMLATGLPGDRFGFSVDAGIINGASIAVIGAPFNDATANNAGLAAVFEPNAAGLWAEVGAVNVPVPADNDRFGTSVAVGECTLLASAPGSDLAWMNGGAIHEITDLGGAWTVGSGITTPDVRPGDLAGTSIAADGQGLAAGVPRDDDRAQDAGAVYVWISGGGAKGDLFHPEGGDPIDWIGEFFPNEDSKDGNMARDDDHDGKSRLLEYIHGDDPTKSEGNDSGALKAIRRPNGKVALSFRLSKRALAEYRVRIENSTDGRFWEEMSDNVATNVSEAGPDLSEITIEPDTEGFLLDERTQIFRARIEDHTQGIPSGWITHSARI